MKCTHCNEKEANTHYKRIINGVKEEMYLCEDCARELGVMKEFEFEPFSMDSFFGNLLGAGTKAVNSLTGIDRCTYCGTTLNDIVSTGKVGCAHCYDKFEKRLAPSIERLHGKTKHVGKHISYTEEPEKKEAPAETLESLKADLKAAVEEQRYEDAIIIRDKINALNKEEK
jgi:protein arginine kinase activator